VNLHHPVETTQNDFEFDDWLPTDGARVMGTARISDVPFEQHGSAAAS
jgi:hypothetical protein